MLEMLKSWYFWKPIVQYIGGGIAVILFCIYSSPDVLRLAFLIFGVYGMLWLIYQLGRAHYESHMLNIKQNYEKLTNKKWDEK